MRRFLFLLVLAFIATANASRGKLSPDVDHALQTNVDGIRMLRGNDEFSTADEERGITTKLKGWTQNVKTWASKLKIVQKAQARLQNRRMKKVEQFVEKKYSETTLYRLKVTPDEYFQALKLDPKLKFIADARVAQANNPGLGKFNSYSVFYEPMKNGEKVRKASK